MKKAKKKELKKTGRKLAKHTMTDKRISRLRQEVGTIIMEGNAPLALRIDTLIDVIAGTALGARNPGKERRMAVTPIPVEPGSPLDGLLRSVFASAGHPCGGHAATDPEAPTPPNPTPKGHTGPVNGGRG